tara:strand:+ start:1906 stop:2064 length:159 start_codon:yes stop_codon:yes gene_type:complete
MNKVDYIYCTSCGYEDSDVEIAYSRKMASGDVWVCPNCSKETMDVDNEYEEE